MLHPRVFAELRKYRVPEAVRALLAPPESPLPALAAQVISLQSALAKIDAGFLKDIARADAGTLDEHQFALMSKVRSEERDRLQERLEALKPKVFEAYLVEKYEQLIPRQVIDFLERVEQLPVLKAKALLQTFVKAIYISGRDGPLEIELRTTEEV